MLACSLVSCGPAAGPSPDDVPAVSLSLEHVSTFGCNACEGIEQIQTVYVSLTPQGRVLLVDAYEPYLRVFEADGTPVSAFGAKGQGPESVGHSGGAYFPPSGVFPGRDEAVLVHDGLPHRIKQFALDGEPLRNTLLPQRVPTLSAFDVTRQRLWVLSYAPGTGPRLDRYDDLEGSVAQPDLVVSDQEKFPLARDGMSRERFAPIAATPDGGIAIGDPRRYSILVLDESGGQVAKLGRDISRPRRSDEEMQRLMEAYRRNPTVLGRQRHEPERELLHFWRFALAYDDSGRLWVLTTRGRGDKSIFDVFNRDGRFLQEVHVEAKIGEGLNSYAIGGGYLAGIVQDELDNTTVTVWRIVES